MEDGRGRKGKILRRPDNVPRHDSMTMIIEDFNAQIDKEDFLNCITNKETMHKKANNNRLRLYNLATANNKYTIRQCYCTKLKHKRQHQIS